MSSFFALLTVVVLIFSIFLGVHFGVSHDGIGVNLLERVFLRGGNKYTWRTDFFGKISCCERNWRESYYVRVFQKDIGYCELTCDADVCRDNVRINGKAVARRMSWDRATDGCVYSRENSEKAAGIQAQRYLDNLNRQIDDDRIEKPTGRARRAEQSPFSACTHGGLEKPTGRARRVEQSPFIHLTPGCVLKT